MSKTLGELTEKLRFINEDISNEMTLSMNFDQTGRTYDRSTLNLLERKKGTILEEIKNEEARLAAEAEKARLVAEAEKARLKAEKEAEAEARRLKAAEEARVAREASASAAVSMLNTMAKKIIKNITNNTYEGSFKSENANIKSDVENHVMDLAKRLVLQNVQEGVMLVVPSPYTQQYSQEKYTFARLLHKIYQKIYIKGLPEKDFINSYLIDNDKFNIEFIPALSIYDNFIGIGGRKKKI